MSALVLNLCSAAAQKAWTNPVGSSGKRCGHYQGRERVSVGSLPAALQLLNALCTCPAVLQEYNYHLGAVNTVTFIDDARRFVSSSDDKSLRVWEFGIPVQIK
jgi:WD40 repeat protein